MSNLSFLIDRNTHLMGRGGYNLFVNTMADGHYRYMDKMTDADIDFWHKCLDEWEALAETEKCQYDVLAVLERA